MIGSDPAENGAWAFTGEKHCAPLQSHRPPARATAGAGVAHTAGLPRSLEEVIESARISSGGGVFFLLRKDCAVVVMVTPPTLMCTLSKLALLSVLTKDVAFFLNHVPLKVGAPQRHFFGSNPHPQHPSMFLSWLPAIKTRGNSFLYDICRRRFLAIFSFWGFETHST